MSAFTCYFDASGTEHDQLILAMGGFMATAESWSEFEVDWKARLSHYKLPYFHRSEFKSWPGMIDDFASLIRTYAYRKFGFVVRNKALHGSISSAVRKKRHMNAYSYAGRACAAHVRLWARENSLATMPELIFESGDTGRGGLIKRMKKDGFQEPSFRPKKDTQDKRGFIIPGVIPLQAADLFAYELFKHSRAIEQKEQAEVSSTWLILDKIPGEPAMATEGRMAEFQAASTRKGGSQ